MDASAPLTSDSSAPSIDLLPNEVLVQVFRHLSFGDALNSSFVCRRWRDVAELTLTKRRRKETDGENDVIVLGGKRWNQNFVKKFLADGIRAVAFKDEKERLRGFFSPALWDLAALTTSCPDVESLDLSCVANTRFNHLKAHAFAAQVLDVVDGFAKLRSLKLPRHDDAFVEVIETHAGLSFPRRLRELAVNGTHRSLDFLERTTSLRSLEISGDTLSRSPVLTPLLRLRNLEKLVVRNEAEPLAEIDVIRLFTTNSDGEDENALGRLKSLTICSVWMHYQNLALIFRRCRDLENLSLSIYLQSLDLLATDPFLHIPSGLKSLTLNMPQTVGEDRALVNFLWRRLLDSVDDHPSLRSVSMFGEGLKTSWGRERECRLVAQQSRYDERGRGPHPSVLYTPMLTGKIERTLFKNINFSVKSPQDWNILKKMLRMIPSLECVSIVWSPDDETTQVYAPTRHKIATRIGRLVIEMSTLTKDVVVVVDSFVAVEAVTVAAFMHESPLKASASGKAATKRDIDEMLQLPLVSSLKSFDLELTRMRYYEPKTDFRSMVNEWRMDNKWGMPSEARWMRQAEASAVGPSRVLPTESMADESPPGRTRVKTRFDYSAWHALSSLTLFYRSAIDPAELASILKGAANLREIKLGCVHDEERELLSVVALDLQLLHQHRRLRRVALNYHHLSRGNMRFKHVRPLAAGLRTLDWRAWSEALEEMVIAFVGLRGVQTEAIIVSRNAAGKMIVRTDDE